MSMWEMKPTWARDQNIRPYSLWQQLFLSQIKRFLQSPASPWAGSNQELPAPPCAGGISLSSDMLRWALATALPSPCPATSPAWYGVGRTVHTPLALCQPESPWLEQRNPATPTAENVHQISYFFFSISGRNGPEPRLERVVLWPCVCHTFPYFQFSLITSTLFTSFKQK